MKKSKRARFKLQRKLLTELPGLGKRGALERKPYPPGQHGMQRIKYSDYRLQLEEKQKLKINYQLKESQLKNLVKEAKRKENNWISLLATFLECRLQNIIFRSGFAGSQMSAAQLISHGHVLVNQKKVNIRSYRIKVGDQISLNLKGQKNIIYLNSIQSPRLEIPDWLVLNNEKNQVRVKDNPKLESIPFNFDESLVTSFYSNIKF